ncbi:MAG: ferredoxin, partial [Actinomycetota bacterium]|nr:ferredoxin [Actinomycetota bacterium]
GADHVEGLELARNRIVRDQAGALVAEPTGETETIDTGLVLRAIGYRGRRMAGLPFDEHSGTLPNDRGRVVDPHTGQPLPGVYAAGWIKRGPTGVIGTNKTCAAETVATLLEDHAAGRLPGITTAADQFADLVRHRQPRRVDRNHWQRIDEYEIARGRSSGRPRVKLTDIEALLRVASGRAPT